jgi:hypothetical protein
MNFQIQILILAECNRYRYQNNSQEVFKNKNNISPVLSKMEASLMSVCFLKSKITRSV